MIGVIPLKIAFVHFPIQIQQACLDGTLKSLKFSSFVYPLKVTFDDFHLGSKNHNDEIIVKTDLLC